MLDRHRVHVASVFASAGAVGRPRGRSDGLDSRYGGFSGGDGRGGGHGAREGTASGGGGLERSEGFSGGGAGGGAGMFAPSRGVSTLNLLGCGAWLAIVEQSRVLEAGFVSRSKAVEIFVEMAFADLCDRTVEGNSTWTVGGGGGSGGSGNFEGMDDTAAMAMSAGCFTSYSAGGDGGVGGGSSGHPGRGSRIFAQRNRDAGALRLARFEGALARIAWDHYEAAEAAAAAAAGHSGSVAVATVPTGVDESMHAAKGRAAATSKPPALVLAARLDAFLSVFFTPNLRRTGGW